jgi:NADH pyrophosphatase NudC (nudix superfamily)
LRKTLELLELQMHLQPIVARIGLRQGGARDPGKLLDDKAKRFRTLRHQRLARTPAVASHKQIDQIGRQRAFQHAGRACLFRRWNKSHRFESRKGKIRNKKKQFGIIFFVVRISVTRAASPSRWA